MCHTLALAVTTYQPKHLDLYYVKTVVSNVRIFLRKLCTLYWNLGDYIRQKYFILAQAKSNDPKMLHALQKG